MKKLSITLILLTAIFVFALETQAKVLPQVGKGAYKQSALKSTGTTISVIPKIRADRKALNVNFSNLQNAKSVSYMLVYKHSLPAEAGKANGQEEAAMGALNLRGGASDKAELLFGTCSKNVCRYHNNIKDARLEVSYTSKLGKKYLKKFKIKV